MTEAPVPEVAGQGTVRSVVLITRPAEDSHALVEAVEALGLTPLVDPMLRIVPAPDAVVDLESCAGILFTSANGVRAFAALNQDRSLPVVAVGPASAEEARQAGFTDITTAGGDVEKLIEAVRVRFSDPSVGSLFHAAGSVTAGDLKGSLESAGYSIRRAVLYSAEAADGLSDATRTALDEGRVLAVPLFSPRTARILVANLQKEQRDAAAAEIHLLALSPAVRDAAHTVTWKATHMAASPTREALISTLQAVMNNTTTSTRQDLGMADEEKKTEATESEANAAPEATETETAEATSEAQDSSDASEPSETEGPEDATDVEAEPDSSLSLNADAVIEAFGGIRPMAKKLNLSVSTVQGWKARGHIPDNRWRDIISAAGANDIDLNAALPKTEEKPKEDVVEAVEATSDDSPWGEKAAEGDQAEAPTEIEGSAEEVTQPDPTPEPEPVPEPANDREAPAPAKSGGGGGLALLVGVVAIAAVVARPIWAPYVDPHVAALVPASGQTAGSSEDLSLVFARIAALEARPVATTEGGEVTVDLSGIEGRLAALEARPVTSGEDGEEVDLSGIEGRLAALEGDSALADRIASVEEAVATLTEAAAGLSTARDEAAALVGDTQTALDVAIERSQDIQTRVIERLAVVETQVEQIALEIESAIAKTAALGADLESQAQDLQAVMDRPALQASSQASIALAASDLETALAAGRSPSVALDRLIGLAGSDAELVSAAEALKSLTATPVSTKAMLTTDFRRDAPAIQAELGAVEGDAWDTLWSGAQSLISVRRKGEAPGDPPVSRAEAALDRGDLNGAVAALSEASGQSATAAAWVAEAERLLQSQEALATLRAAVATRLGPSGEGDAS